MSLPHTKEIVPGLPQEIDKEFAPWTELVREDFHVQMFEDIYPVTPGHLLFVPKCKMQSITGNRRSNPVPGMDLTLA